MCCTQCKQVLIFLNKCNFLRHAREHREKGTVMQFNGAQIKPIPAAMCKPLAKDAYFLNGVVDADKYMIVPNEDLKKLQPACMMVGLLQYWWLLTLVVIMSLKKLYIYMNKHNFCFSQKACITPLQTVRNLPIAIKS